MKNQKVKVKKFTSISNHFNFCKIRTWILWTTDRKIAWLRFQDVAILSSSTVHSSVVLNIYSINLIFIVSIGSCYFNTVSCEFTKKSNKKCTNTSPNVYLDRSNCAIATALVLYPADVEDIARRLEIETRCHGNLDHGTCASHADRIK